MSATEFSVVLPVVWPASTLAAARTLSKQGVNTIAIGHDKFNPTFKSNYVDECVYITDPRENVGEYRESLLDLALREDVQAIFPIRELDIYLLSKFKSEFSDHIDTPWVDYETFDIARDRIKLFEKAEELGVAVPETSLLDDYTHTSNSVVKSRYSVMVENGTAFYPGVEFLEEVEDVDPGKVREEMRHEPIVQEYISGQEFGYFALAEDGNIKRAFQHRRVRSQTYSGGASVFRRAEYIPELEELGARLVADLDWTGPLMIEFKRDRTTGEFHLMEINPRFWGSLSLPIAAGVDFPRSYYKLFQGENLEWVDIKTTPNYDLSTQCQHLVGEAMYLFSILAGSHPDFIEKPRLPSEFLNVVADTFLSEFDFLSFDDPKPFVWDVARHARGFYDEYL